MYIECTLTSYEIWMAGSVGLSRNINSLKRGSKNTYGLEGLNDWQIHIEGALGEIALAKTLGMYWDGSVDTFKNKGDVGILEVRTTSKHTNCLLLREKDDPKKIYWLVTGICPTYRIQGWLKGEDGMKSEFFRQDVRYPAWFVPIDKLNTPDMKNY